MSLKSGLMVVLLTVSLAACETSRDDGEVTDVGFDGGALRDGVASVWVDPDGCQHWYIDDGIEGFMTPRLNRDGTPKCQDTRGVVTLKDGTQVAAEQEPVNAGS